MIGWALDRTMEDELTLTALRMALKQRAITPGLVHHSEPRRAPPSASSSKRSTTKSDCTPPSATCRRRALKRKPLRGAFLYEFSEASGNLSTDGDADDEADAPASRIDEFPAGYSLQQSPLALHQPVTSML